MTITANEVRVSQILVHPIKSCRGTSVQSAKYTPEGIEFDRRWCIIDVEAKRVITAIAAPKMILITPQIERDDSSPYGGVLTLTFPSDSGCEPFSIPLAPTDEMLGKWTILPEIILFPGMGPVDGYICESLGPAPAAADTPATTLSKYLGKSVQLMYKGPRPRPVLPSSTFPDLQGTATYQDLYPLLILSEESMDEINDKTRDYVGVQGVEERWKADKVKIEQFRPNIVTQGGGAFAEDNWEEITIGDGPSLTFVAKCGRCLLPNVSPETGIRDNAVPFKILTKFRAGLDPAQKLTPCVGCYAIPATDGVFRVGDVVVVKRAIC